MSSDRLRVRGAARLAVGEALSFTLGGRAPGASLPGFVLHHRDGFFAYVNRCPHWAVDLDLGDGRFYAEDVDRIYCKNHGALFRVTDGLCDHGPCVGTSLTPLALEVQGDDIWVSLPPR